MSYVRVAKVDDIGSEEALQVEVEGKTIALLRHEGEIYAFSDICTHEHAHLSEGFVEGPLIECPLHGSQFDIRSGKVLSLPASQDLPTFPVKIEGEDVLVAVEEQEG